MNSGIWRSPRVWLGFAISVAAIGVAVYRVDLGEAAAAFRDANYYWLLPGLALAVGSFFLRAVRWQALLYPQSMPLERLFWIMAIGYSVTTLLPLRLGDFVRAHLVGEAEQESKARALTTIAVEHLLDALSVLVILLMLTPFVPLPGWVRLTMIAVAAIILGSAILIAWTQSHRGQAVDLTGRALGWLPERLTDRVRQTVDSAIDGFSALGSPRQAFKAVGWSGAQWFVGGLMMWVTLYAFDLPATFTVAMFMVAMSALALTIPSSPGFIGVYHAIIIESLAGVFGASRGEAASFAIVAHLLLFLPPVVLASLVLLRDPEMWDQLLRWRSGETGTAEGVTGRAQASN